MGKYVLIGGSYGIGLEVAKMLAQHGHSVHVFSRTIGGLDKISSVSHHTYDALSGTLDLFGVEGGIDGLVYLPGSIQLKPFHRTTPQDFLDDMRINFIGAVESVQAFLPKLKESKGSIVLLSTVAAAVGMPFHSSISAAKSALEGFARSLASELAPLVRVNVVAPSLTETPLAEKFLGTPEKKEAAGKRHPLGRYGQAIDIAAAINFLLSPQSAWVTGQVLRIDGGMSTLKMM